jgi:hypothetical protein
MQIQIDLFIITWILIWASKHNAGIMRIRIHNPAWKEIWPREARTTNSGEWLGPWK